MEPFAGAAGYACNYPDRKVVLVEKYPIVAGIWRYLIAVRAAEIRAIPEVDDVAALPAWVPQEARWLVGFWMNDAASSPRRTLSTGRRKLRAIGCASQGWTPATRERVATQVERIRHWQVVEGDFWQGAAHARRATWFIDPPYNNAAGRHYASRFDDYDALAEWCRLLVAGAWGQVIVCENEGASWLPFRPFATFKRTAMTGKAGSREVVWP